MGKPYTAFLERMAVLSTYTAVGCVSEMYDDAFVSRHELQAVVERLKVHAFVMQALRYKPHAVRVGTVHGKQLFSRWQRMAMFYDYQYTHVLFVFYFVHH